MEALQLRARDLFTPGHAGSRCIERPPGGPPCAPLGKECGIEMHLPAVIDAIRSSSLTRCASASARSSRA